MSFLMVAAIDFGTTYSGWAFSFKHDFDRDPMKVTAKNWKADQCFSAKAPTCVLIKPDGKTFDSFGYEAETKYAELGEEDLHRPWYFFRRFKMMLFDKMKIDRKVLLDDETGKKLPATIVFSLVIRYLKEDLLTECNKQLADTLREKDIQWVLTVPAIWNDAAKQFMREAAQIAGIKGKRILIALEPEAASLYCRQIPVKKGPKRTLACLKPGTKYVVLDAGGGTIDFTVHQVIVGDKLREIYRASGGAWGGTKVDEEYEQFLEAVAGKEAMNVFKKEHTDDYIDILQAFEIKKRGISTTSSERVTLRIPPTFTDTILKITGNTIEEVVSSSEFRGQVTFLKGKLRVEADTVRSFFKKSVDSIDRHVSSLMQERSVRDCTIILMVGGFSESQILQNAIQKHWPKKTVIIPEGAGLAVLKGAVIFGHRQTTIAERICRYTYGLKWAHTASSRTCNHPASRTTVDKDGKQICHDIFKKHVTIGQNVKLGEEQSEKISSPIVADQNHITFKMYATTSSNPLLVTEPGCVQLGMLTIEIPDKSLGTQRKFGSRFIFGGTEIAVKIEDKATGETYITAVDFLE